MRTKRKGWLCVLCVFDLGFIWNSGCQTSYRGKCAGCESDCSGEDNREYHEWSDAK